MFKPHNEKMGVVVSSEAQQMKYSRIIFNPLRLMNRIETDASK